MSGYNFNLYQSGGIPDQGINGLPLVIADANLPTQAVSDSPIRRDTSLDYSPHMVESNFHTPATTQPPKNVQFARVSASGNRVRQQFEATPQPKQPSLWNTVVRAVVGGKIKTGSSYAASNDYTSQGAGGGLTEPGVSVSGGGAGRTATVGTVTMGGARTA